MERLELMRQADQHREGLSQKYLNEVSEVSTPHSNSEEVTQLADKVRKLTKKIIKRDEQKKALEGEKQKIVQVKTELEGKCRVLEVQKNSLEEQHTTLKEQLAFF